jgi:antitoxin (DNA-binding transcriptional repressor) of toxin-antitoxin stability system
MEATLTELRRDTLRVVRAADKSKVIITRHGSPAYKIERIRKIGRAGLLQALRGLGPIDLPRK